MAGQSELVEEQALLPIPESAKRLPVIEAGDPGAEYLDPSINIFSVNNVSCTRDLLPDFQLAKRFLDVYWERAHPIARIVHKPSFEARWDLFWTTLQAGEQPPWSLQALVSTILFTGVVTLTQREFYERFRQEKHSWVTRLQASTAGALNQAQALRSTKVETLQAFVAYLVRSNPHPFSAKRAALHPRSFVLRLTCVRSQCVDRKSLVAIQLWWRLPSAVLRVWVFTLMSVSAAITRLKPTVED